MVGIQFHRGDGLYAKRILLHMNVHTARKAVDFPNNPKQFYLRERGQTNGKRSVPFSVAAGLQFMNYED